MALKGKTVREQIWNYLKSKGLSNHGTAGLMGNLFAESGLNPKNLQNTSEKKLGYTDDSYTQAVDDGSYDNFVKDSAGYGLAQWTYWSRKEKLLNFVRSRKCSVGDLEAQLDFLVEELSESYGTVLAKLKSARSVKAASDVVLTGFEKPKDQSNAVKEKRAGYGQQYYDEFISSKKEGGNSNMTEAQLRQKVVGVMQGWIGCKESNGSHKKIIDIYNAHKPLARSYAVKYTDAWCATGASAAAIVAELTDIIPTECGCNQMIELFKKMGAWQENDAYVPSPGDYIFYDWQDSGVGDNTGAAGHVGVVEKVSGSTITVIECNINDACGRRNLKVNGRYIRGYGVPKYSKKATVPKGEDVNKSGTLKIGDVVNFTGSKQYTSSYSGATKKSAKPCQARVTAISAGKPHPYHLVALSGGKVYGWCDAGDIEGASGAGSGGSFKVGDSVSFTGDKHYTSSYAGASGKSAKPCKAKITAANKNGKYPYHVVGDKVHGWVKASDISK